MKLNKTFLLAVAATVVGSTAALGILKYLWLPAMSYWWIAAPALAMMAVIFAIVAIGWGTYFWRKMKGINNPS